jgi:hypothetical protein
MRFDDHGDIYIRQSWVDTAFRCAERGRFAIVKPDWDFGGDAAHLGTGAHAAIETHLQQLIVGETLSFDPRAIIRQAIDEKIAEEGVRWDKYSTVEQLVDNAERCYEGWVRGILPVLEENDLIQGAHTEVKFCVHLLTLGDGRRVFLEGTSDFVPNHNSMWDWKTGGQPYRDREKQKYAVQGTVYTLAAVLGGMPNDIEYRYPMDFTYGVMVRGVRKSNPQLLTVQRTQAHADFMIERVKSYLDLALNFTLERSWPRDDDHFLCSAKWCPWWVLCKGAHSIDDSIPVQFTVKEAA